MAAKTWPNILINSARQQVLRSTKFQWNHLLSNNLEKAAASGKPEPSMLNDRKTMTEVVESSYTKLALGKFKVLEWAKIINISPLGSFVIRVQTL
ncbi:hypothetical protein V6N13_113884 [Hibiscus sabdariffa]